MTAPCFKDTCSLKWTTAVDVDLGPQYIGAVDIDGDATPSATPTIACGDNGLEVIVSPTDDNLLVKTSNGLFAALPAGLVVPFYENPGNVPENLPAQPATAYQRADVQDDVTTPVFQNSPILHSWNNSTGRSVLVLVTGNFDLKYAILGPGSPENTDDILRVGGVLFPGIGTDPDKIVVPFNAHWQARLKYGIDTTFPFTDSLTPSTAETQNFETSGMMSTFQGPNKYQFQTARRPFNRVFRLEDQERLTVRGAIAHEGSDQTINVVARGTAELAGVGFGLRDLQFAIFPTS